MGVFDPVNVKVEFPELEKQILDYWERERIFPRTNESRLNGPIYSFYEGPPTANGLPGTHHILARAVKDVFPRFWTMKGYYVPRKGGWDTHGLPVELEVEKELGINSKDEIENIGIEVFNKRCKESVLRYVREWEYFTKRIGFWLDLDSAYWTFSSSYIESVWWALKTIWDKGLIYRSFKVVPYCPRCMTPLSSHELAQSYEEDVPDPSVYVKFKLKDFTDTWALVWTTTPWTLPANVALAVDPESSYVEVRTDEGSIILAEERVSLLGTSLNIVRRFKGQDLIGLSYEPVFPYVVPNSASHKIYGAEFVSMEEGTGIVHIAGPYGEDDMKLCQDNGIPIQHTVDMRGRFLDFVADFKGLFVKDADVHIIENLQKRNILFRHETIRHTYPFCWRCGTPLLYYALYSWFIKTTAIKEKLLQNNEATNWVPAYIKDGRMRDWLENLVDWSISRMRYWGTPIPIWQCDSCGEYRCIGSVQEIGLSLESDLHRPFIDEVTLKCKCGGVMRRIPDVLDVWFDSGCMPFAQYHYPFENQDIFEKTFPADFISEAIDQTRGWFYSLMAVSTLVFGINSYKNVICLNLVVDKDGRKMSKSLGNTIDPFELINFSGADATRWYFYTSANVGERYRVSRELVQRAVRQFLLTLWNVYAFFVTYANIDNYRGEPAPVALQNMPVLDRWILSKLNRLIADVERHLNEYELNVPAREIQAFVDDLSNWYVRCSRRRFWKSGSDTDKQCAYATLYEVLMKLSQVMAPFVPFISEHIYKNLSKCQDNAYPSVHMSEFPKPDALVVDHELEEQMAQARKIVERGLAARDQAQIKVRQPLAKAKVKSEPIPADLVDIVKNQLNIKELVFDLDMDSDFDLDTNITDELRMEGLARELVRRLQEMRKRAGFDIADRIHTVYNSEDEFISRTLEHYAHYVAGETLSIRFEQGLPGNEYYKEHIVIDGIALDVGMRKVEVGHSG
jgi:isoleucyl-tRNA synthetase